MFMHTGGKMIRRIIRQAGEGDPFAVIAPVMIYQSVADATVQVTLKAAFEFEGVEQVNQPQKNILTVIFGRGRGHTFGDQAGVYIAVVSPKNLLKGGTIPLLVAPY